MSRLPRPPRGISTITLVEEEPQPRHVREAAPPLPPTFAPRTPYQPIAPVQAPTPPPRRGGGGVVITFLLLLAMAGAAVYWFVLREDEDESASEAADAAVVEDSASPSSAADLTRDLPDTSFVRPAYASATFEESFTQIALRDGSVVDEEIEIAVQADYSRQVARIDGGGAYAVDGRPQIVVFTADHQFTPGAVFGQPWTRAPRQRVEGATPMDAYQHLPLYQELVTSSVRDAARHVVETTEVLDDVPVTTYRFEVDVRALGQNLVWSDTARSAEAEKIDARLFVGAVRISVDPQGLVRLFEYDLDQSLARELVEATGGEVPVVTSFRREIGSLSTGPLELEAPPNFVDAPAG